MIRKVVDVGVRATSGATFDGLFSRLDQLLESGAAEELEATLGEMAELAGDDEESWNILFMWSDDGSDLERLALNNLERLKSRQLEIFNALPPVYVPPPFKKIPITDIGDGTKKKKEKKKEEKSSKSKVLAERKKPSEKKPGGRKKSPKTRASVRSNRRSRPVQHVNNPTEPADLWERIRRELETSTDGPGTDDYKFVAKQLLKASDTQERREEARRLLNAK